MRGKKKNDVPVGSRWRMVLLVLMAGICIGVYTPQECMAVENLVVELTGQEEYQELEQTVEELLGTESTFDFQEYLMAVISGEEKLSLAGIRDAVLEGIRTPFIQLRQEFVRLVAMVLFTAIFTSFTRAFQNGQVSESGFYVSYLLLVSMLAAGYLTISEIVSATLEKLFGFMQALIPVFSTTLLLASGSLTSQGAAATMLILLGILDKVLLSILLPGMHIYMMLVLANHLSGEEPLGKLSELVLKLVRMALKGMLGLVAAVMGLQAMVTPVIDATKQNAAVKVSKLLPGIGSLFSGVAETLLGASNILKNAVGSAGMVVIGVLCALPMVKVLLYVLCYRAGAAVVEPVADKRILHCMSDTAEGLTALLQLLFTGAVSFVLTLAILVRATT
ncbi:MAG: stage III sporulation protein AE [Lachnospiraceae bacterium]|nr:stage III sporulation protein AE [Lachnospiraceae bacterium]